MGYVETVLEPLRKALVIDRYVFREDFSKIPELEANVAYKKNKKLGHDNRLEILLLVKDDDHGRNNCNQKSRVYCDAQPVIEEQRCVYRGTPVATIG